MQRFRLAESVEFTYLRYGKSNTSELVVVQDDDWTKPICNGCYGELLSRE